MTGSPDESAELEGAAGEARPSGEASRGWRPAAGLFSRLRHLRRRWRQLRPLGRSSAGETTWFGLRRVAVAIIGGTIVALGLVMFVAPGPALLVVPLGLFVLGFEFVCALRLQRRIVSETSRAASRAKSRWWRR